MDSDQLRHRLAAVRAEVAALTGRLASDAPELHPDELFELAGDLQGILNAVDGAQLVVIAHAASHETRLTDRGPVQVHHALGYVDAMTSTEVSLSTGVGQWAAGRKVGLASALAGRFPRLLACVVAGDLATVNAHKVVSACDGLDDTACTAVEAVMVDRLVGMDPARITSVVRRVATRIAADQLAGASARNKRDRCVQVSPGPDGTTTWWAQLPAGASAAAWAAVTELGDRYCADDAALTTDQARADAFLDLLLTNVTVTAKVTLGIPVITGEDAEVAHDAAVAARSAEDGTGASGGPLVAVGGQGLGASFSVATALSGCEVPGVGWIDAEAVGALLETVPLEVGRALLDARTGTTVESVTSAYRPTRAMTDFVALRDGTCRMWGCSRPAVACDVDHARAWPDGPTSPANLGGLCRRHHRLKQRRRWAYRLDPDGTATWTSPHGVRRVTLPEHALLPQPPPRTTVRVDPTPVPAPPF